MDITDILFAKSLSGGGGGGGSSDFSTAEVTVKTSYQNDGDVMGFLPIKVTDEGYEGTCAYFEFPIRTSDEYVYEIILYKGVAYGYCNTDVSASGDIENDGGYLTVTGDGVITCNQTI